MQRVAVWNTAFLGDAVLTLPVLQSVKLAYPEVLVDFYVRGGLAPLFSAHPDVHEAISYDKRGKQRGLAEGVGFAREVRRKNYDVFICAHTSVRSGALARFSGARARVGYSEVAGSSLWFTQTVSRRFTELHEIERLLELLKPLGIAPKSLTPSLSLPDSARAGARDVFSRFDFPVLGVHPGSVWETKRWPAAYFAEVATQAMKEGAGVMLFAGPSELEQAAEVRRVVAEKVSPALMKARFIDCSGALQLVDLAAYIGCLSHYLTNDSGPMHIAWCQGIPVTALFGPTTKSLGFFPQGALSQVAELDLPCRPCGLHGGHDCPQKNHYCMTQLVPEIVWPMVKNRLFTSRLPE